MKAKDYKNWILHYAKKQWYLIAASSIIALGMVGLQLASPIPLKILIDNVFGAEKLTWLFSGSKSGKDLLPYVAASFIGIVLVRELYSVFQQYTFRLFSQLVDKRVLRDIYKRITQIPEHSTSKKSPGEYIFAATNESQQISQLILVSLVTIIGSILTIIAIGTLLFKQDKNLTLLSLSVFIPAIILVAFVSRKLDKVSQKTEDTHSKLFDIISEGIHKMRLIHLFVLEKTQLKRIESMVAIRNKNARSQTMTQSTLSGLDEIILGVSTAIVVYVGGVRVFDGALSLGDLLLFMAYLGFLYDPFAAIVSSIGESLSQMSAIRQAFETTQYTEQAPQSDKPDLVISKGSVEIDGLTVMRGQTTILDSINLEIKPGEFIAIIGPSGSGKSTLINALLRFTDMTAGRIKIDGQDIMQVNEQSLRKSISVVDQEPDLLSLSIDENIAIHDIERPNHLPDSMKGALFAELQDFVEDRENRYQSQINPDSVSGGQRQRLGLARAYYKDSLVYIMDEPTSALDDHTKTTIARNIVEYLAGTSRIVVTHDLGLIKYADRVLMCKDKTLVDITGSTNIEELLK